MPDFSFRVDTAIAKGMVLFFQQLEQRLELDRPLTAFSSHSVLRIGSIFLERTRSGPKPNRLLWHRKTSA